MINLDTILQTKLDEFIKSGKLDAIVESQISEMIRSSCDHIFSSYGEISKKIETTLKEKINIDLSVLNLDEYSHNLSIMINNIVNKSLTEEGFKKIEKSLNELVAGDTPKEIKLSDIIEQFKDAITEYNDDYFGSNVSFYYENSDEYPNFYHIYIDKKQNKRKYECDIRLFIADNIIKSVIINGRELNKALIMGGLFDIEALLFKLYTSGTKIIIDPDDVNINIKEADES